MHEVTNLITQVIGYVESIPASTWAAFGGLLTTGLLVSVLTELYKRHLVTKKEINVAKSFLGLILTGLSGAVTLAQSVVVYGTVNPHFLGTHTPQVLGFASAVYLFGGSKAYAKVADFIGRFQAAFKAVSGDATPVTPTHTLPVTPATTTPAVDPSSEFLG